MRENTPPRMPEIEDDDAEEVEFDNDLPPDEDDLDDDFDQHDYQEVTLDELETFLGSDDGDQLDEHAEVVTVPDEAELTFRAHLAPVFSCHMHPQYDLAVTGGEDDTAYIWNTNNASIVKTLSEHHDTVTEVRFSHDGHYLATGDMAGEVFVYKVNDSDNSADNHPKIQQVWKYSMGDMIWMSWHYASHVLMAGAESGEIYVWRIPSGECKIMPSSGGRCEIAQLSNDGKKLFAAYADHKVKLWDLKSCQVLVDVDESHPLGHKYDILAVACDKDAPIYISGDGEGKILVCTNNGPVNVHKVDDAIECLAFSPSTELKLFASGCIGGKVVIWDYAKNAMRCVCENTTATDDGITKMEWINDYTLLVGTMKGRILAFDGRTGQQKFSLSGHIAHIYDFSYKKSENILLSVSEDMTAKIFHVPQISD